MAREGKEITITPGTVIPIEPDSGGSPRSANDLIITPIAGAAGEQIRILNGSKNAVTGVRNWILVTVIGPAPALLTSAAPLPFRIDRSQANQPKLDLSEWGLDGTHAGDKVAVSWEPSR